MVRLARATGLVVVNIGYRVGPFGFLDLRPRIRGATSNVGLRDLLAGLRWIARNIVAFGGDPERVTIGGQSAGAGCVTALLRPRRRPDSRRGDRAQPARASRRRSRRRSKIAGRYLRLLAPEAAADPHAVAPAALTAPIERLLADVAADHPGTLACAPVTGDDLLPLAPLDAATAGATHAVPTLLGWNRDEASAFRGSDAIVVHREALEAWVGEAPLRARYGGYPATARRRGGGDRPVVRRADARVRGRAGTPCPDLGRTVRPRRGGASSEWTRRDARRRGRWYLFGNVGRGMWRELPPTGRISTIWRPSRRCAARGDRWPRTVTPDRAGHRTPNDAYAASTEPAGRPWARAHRRRAALTRGVAYPRAAGSSGAKYSSW